MKQRSPLQTAAFVACIALPLSPAAAQVVAPSGEAVYRQRCASCHDHVTARVPPREALSKMSPARILRTLDFGLMMAIAYPMRRDEREAVAHFLGSGKDEVAPPASAFCAGGKRIMSGAASSSWTGWGASSATRSSIRCTAAD